jgi:hypothetical protein
MPVNNLSHLNPESTSKSSPIQYSAITAANQAQICLVHCTSYHRRTCGIIHRPTYKPHSVQRFYTACVVISLGCTSPCSSSGLPGISASSLKQGGEPPPTRRDELHPCLALLRIGVAWPPSLLRTPVVSYTTFSPLPVHLETRSPSAVCLCGPIRQVAPPRVLPGISLYGVRTFLSSG